MAKIHTEISLEESLYQKINTLAEEMKVSCSQLLTSALEEYIQRHYNQQHLQNINEAYADGLDESEKNMLEGMRQHQRYLQQQEW